MSYVASIESGAFSGPEDVDLSDREIGHLMDAFVAIDLDILAKYPNIKPLYQLHDEGLIRYYRPQPLQTPQGEVAEPDHWRDILGVMERGYGDCKDLAAWRVAEIRRAGGWAEPHLITGWAPAGKRLYHIVVRYPDGVLEDPSKVLGMTADF